MKLKKPFSGIVAFIIVLLTMPLGHALMILMENTFGHEHVYLVAIILGLVGFALAIVGVIVNKDTPSTFLGLFAGLFVWTGWIEFSFVYYANRYNIEPLMENGQVVTKSEYLLMPSSVGFWAVLMIYYFLNSRTGCRFFNQFHKKLKLTQAKVLKPNAFNVTMTTFMELITLLWTFYLMLLFVYDNSFFGDHHPMTYVVAFGSLLWAGYLMIKLLKFNKLGYSIRYAIPTVIIFWNFVEILGRWGLFKEFWIQPQKYAVELTIILLVLIALMAIAFLQRKKKVVEN